MRAAVTPLDTARFELPIFTRLDVSVLLCRAAAIFSSLQSLSQPFLHAAFAVYFEDASLITFFAAQPPPTPLPLHFLRLIFDSLTFLFDGFSFSASSLPLIAAAFSAPLASLI